ncbi:peptidase [Bacilli bacterium]|nr:peptidase [Bacilli bacterium]
MKLTKKNLLSSLALATVALAPLAPAAVPFLSPAPITASAEVVANDTSQRKITLHKYAIDNLEDLGVRADGKPAKTGSALESKLAGLDKLNGVKFKISRVKALGTPAASLTNPDKQVLGKDYAIDTSYGMNGFTAGEQTGTTSGNGELIFDLGRGLAADGTYLVEEMDSTGVSVAGSSPLKTTEVKRKISPFFVHVPMTDRDTRDKLLYDITVYPKNEVDHPLNPTKTIDGQKGSSLLAGLPFRWEATVDINPSDFYWVAKQAGTIPGTNIPIVAGQDVYMDYFTITDALNPKTDLLSTKVQVLDGSNAWVDLTPNIDYTFTTGSVAMAPASTSKITLTQDGMKEISKTISGAKKLRVVYEVKVNDPKFDGTIDNEFTVERKKQGLTPDVEKNSTKPQYFTGGFDIKKTAEDTGGTLAGAVFHIATSQADAKAKKFLATDGKSYPLGTSGVNFVTTTSKSNGLAAFDGLPLTWYTDTNNNGKQDDSEPTKAQADIKRDYWVVETKAPANYHLYGEPIPVTVDLETYKDATIELSVNDKRDTDLPFTGGTGMKILITIAIGAIVIGTTMIVFEKKSLFDKKGRE